MTERNWAGILRLFDIACALCGLIVLFPGLAVLAAAIFLDDGPPVLFRQKRIGKRGVPFTIWKFRTMRTGSIGKAITVAGDHRVTRVGAWLRKFKLDELLQLVNVLRGDMSLVGPRPEVPIYVEPEEPLWQIVLQSKPGITDPASLLYRNEEQILANAADSETYYRRVVLPAKLRLNVQYIQSRSFGSDLRLILLTIRHSFFPNRLEGDGANLRAGV